jgi:hypothetical protein
VEARGGEDLAGARGGDGAIVDWISPESKDDVVTWPGV